jgi:Mn-dependent DtxR family transcriptional regulator
MSEQEIRNELLLMLIFRYEQQRDQYLTLSQQAIDCSSARWAISELRNEGLVEEQVRGVIRLTALGYRKYRSAPLSYATGGCSV